MIIIKPERITSAALSAYEGFFVELWHSMVHRESLDSYRVRCMNPRTIVRELAEELSLNFKIKDDEIKNLCLEVKYLIEEDPVCTKYYPSFVNLIIPTLSNPPKKPSLSKKTKDEGPVDERHFREFCFLVDDFSLALQRSYFSHMVDFLPGAIKPNNENEIRIVTSNMLSDLLDRGWSLESLVSWPRAFLSNPAKSFSEKLQYALHILQLPVEDYEVTLKVSNCSKLSLLGTQGSFIFEPTLVIAENSTELANKFAKTSQAVCYARTTVADHDFREAAIQAREKLEQLINLLRA